MNIELVHLKRSYERYRNEIDQAVLRVLASGTYVLGEEVKLFEEEFATFCGAKQCVGVASGTDALLLSLKALGISKDDEVITVANSFVSTATTISMLGAVPVFVDVDERTCNLDAKKLEEKITFRTKAIVLVHLYGQPADMHPIIAIAKKHNLRIVEDACQAHGARYHGKSAGTLGDIAAFSFFPSKNLGGYGDGGAVVTDDPELAEKVRMYRTYGSKQRDHYITWGVNSRLDTIQAAILRVKLRHLPSWIEKRRELTVRYTALLSGSSVKVLDVISGAESACHLFVIRSKKRDALQAFLKEKGVSTGIHYPVPIHMQPIYTELGYAKGSVPVTEMLATEILSLPLCPELLDEELAYVVKSIKDFEL